MLARLGMKPGDAFNMLLAQLKLREWLPFEVSTRPPVLMNSEQQAAEWQEALGAYDRQGRNGSPQPSGGCEVK